MIQGTKVVVFDGWMERHDSGAMALNHGVPRNVMTVGLDACGARCVVVRGAWWCAVPFEDVMIARHLIEYYLTTRVGLLRVCLAPGSS